MSDTLHVVCPNCEAVNRIPTARLAAAPKCGQCHRRLFTGDVVNLTQSNFQKHVERNDLPLVVDFWAPWCGPCLNMAPQFAQAVTQLEPSIRLAKVDTDAESNLAGQYNIRSIPTLALFQAGREIARHSGAMGTSDIVRWVRTHA